MSMRLRFHETARSRRLGIARPSLDSMRVQRTLPRTDENPSEPDYDSYSEEEESLLSRKHGEASEVTQSRKRKATTDQDIAQEYASQERSKARRKVHQTVTPEDLIRPKGLTVVRNGFAPMFHPKKSRPLYQKTPKSMAKYSSKLVRAYAHWMENMTQGLPLHETMWKLRSLSSKTRVKEYLQELRKSVRNDHVERLLGLEAAESLLLQLEDYYHHLEDNAQPDKEETTPEVSNDSRTTVVTNPYQTSTRVVEANPSNNRQVQLQAPSPKQHVLEDSDDEEEADFSIQGSVTPSVQKKSQVRSRVLDDSDDDDDDANVVGDHKEDDSNDEQSPSTKRLEEQFESVRALLSAP